jgi:hypothetical protein
MLQLLAFWLGGPAMGFTVGLGVLFLLREFALEFMHHEASTTASARVAIVQMVVGALALIIATLIAAGFRMRPRPRQLNTPAAAILASGADARTQIAAVIVYQLVVLALAEILLASSLFAPAKTKR